MKKISLAASILVALSMPAHADPGQEGDMWIGVFGEYYSTDQEKSGFPNFLSDATGLGAEFGYRFKPEWAARFEFSHLSVNSSQTDDISANRYGADAMYFLPDDLVYVFGGVRHLKMVESSNMLDFGLGKHWDINDKWKAITEVASYLDVDKGYTELGVKVGLAYTFGEPAPELPKDSDNDGVNDPQDICPNTAPGTAVDAKGCDIDTDKDGVLNAMDMCPGTPMGTKVDSSGCDEDLDGDGVLNTIDACPDTPKGTPVGAKGCSLVLDTDQDGILDTKDQCPNTPVIDKVDEVGCSIFLEKEVSQSLKVTFANNSSIIQNQNDPVFADFANFMKRFPNTSTVIEGHASAVGDDAYNMMLSQKRADSVRKLLITKYGIDADRLTAVGYGETQLLDTSNTAEAHAKNRRITARITATEKVKALKN